MREFAGDISQNLLGNIKYRNNVVTGVIAVDNGNYTYDVYISNSDEAYPNIPTTMREPDFAVGDAVEILMEYGNREMPIIIGLAKKIVQEVEVIDINPVVGTTLENIIFVLYYTDANYVKTFSKDDGTLISTIPISETIYWETDTFCVDSDNNFYYLDMSDVLYKKGSTGNAITSKDLSATTPESIAIGADGYLYSRAQSGVINQINQRRTSDLESLGTVVTLTPAKNYYGLAIDSDGYFYVSNGTDDQMEKWSTTGQIATQAVPDGVANSLCIVSNTLAWAYNAGAHGAYSMPTNLGSSESDFLLGEIDGNVNSASSIDNHFIFVGLNDVGNFHIENYTSAKVLSWEKEIETSESWESNSHIGAYPF